MTWYDRVRYVYTRYRSVSMHLWRRTCISTLLLPASLSLSKQSIFIKILYNVARSTGEDQPDLESSSSTTFRCECSLLSWTIRYVFAYSRVWWQLDHLGCNGEWRQKLRTRRRIKEEWSTRQRQKSGSIKAKTARYCWVQTHAVTDKASSRTHHISNRGLPDNP